MSNSFILNNYILLIKVIRLTILAICSLFCLFTLSCSNNPQFVGSAQRNRQQSLENSLNINVANIEQLEKLPEIGSKTARQIVAHREKYGEFRKVEHLILVRGMSDKKFREIESFVKVE